jgi:hypothetical protein
LRGPSQLGDVGSDAQRFEPVTHCATPLKNHKIKIARSVDL